VEIYEVYWCVPAGMSEDETSFGLFANRKRAERELKEQIKNDETDCPDWYSIRTVKVNIEKA
jgi:hypothetical protein